MLGDLLGANATWGPLAFRLKWPVVTWYNLLKPGTFSRPLLPGVAYRRRRWQCAGYALLVAGARCLIGFRPCEATRAMVAFARRKRVPFALVPCCAVAPWRTLPSTLNALRLSLIHN